MINAYFLDFNQSRPNPQIGCYTAYKGFEAFGAHCTLVNSVDDIPDLNNEDIVVGGIGFVLQRLRQLGISDDFRISDYPEELHKYLGRNVWESTMETVASNPNCFIKPMDIQTGSIIYIQMKTLMNMQICCRIFHNSATVRI